MSVCLFGHRPRLHVFDARNGGESYVCESSFAIAKLIFPYQLFTYAHITTAGIGAIYQELLDEIQQEYVAWVIGSMRSSNICSLWVQEIDGRRSGLASKQIKPNIQTHTKKRKGVQPYFVSLLKLLDVCEAAPAVGVDNLPC